jgi:DNA modification methylase
MQNAAAAEGGRAVSIRILAGDCRELLRTLPDRSVHCCVTSPPYFGLRSYLPEDHPSKALEIGLESTAEAYVSALVEVFREVRRVLRDDGTLWLNLGDSYAGSWGAQGRTGGNTDGKHAYNRSVLSRNQISNHPKRAKLTGGIRADGVKPKDLYGIPWMVAFALRADGWFLRQDIIWSKPNPMPESVRDRCTKAHEYVFLLSKSGSYYYDQDAILEPLAPSSAARLTQQNLDQQAGSNRVPGKTNGAMKAVRRSGNVERKPGSARGCPENTGSNVCGSVPWEGDTRNKRSVWTISTKPYSGAHFATFPPDLIEPCILAGAPHGGVVLDPFGGHGTTGMVADRLGRDAILCELHPENCTASGARIQEECPLFVEVEMAGGAT